MGPVARDTGNSVNAGRRREQEARQNGKRQGMRLTTHPLPMGFDRAGDYFLSLASTNALATVRTNGTAPLGTGTEPRRMDVKLWLAPK